ncbi:hypothetical protein RND71_028406 [Anisodus tanguticus]|uniref:caffeoyl-CoA O-methyltransferase n=1 Tax=Anisodus tanguticus TaxID=243964 RepID=A0AAE1RJL6_9SOLA|nr:hypothetical protein RND71_028406 [Anisodus tanguticus]
MASLSDSNSNSKGLLQTQELHEHDNRGSFDFAFVDADKVNYQKYHERLLQLVKVGGIIVYDNTLWFGTVAMPEESVRESMKPSRVHTIEFNRFLAADICVQISQVPLGDGITICSRLKISHVNLLCAIESKPTEYSSGEMDKQHIL